VFICCGDVGKLFQIRFMSSIVSPEYPALTWPGYDVVRPKHAPFISLNIRKKVTAISRDMPLTPPQYGPLPEDARDYSVPQRKKIDTNQSAVSLTALALRVGYDKLVLLDFANFRLTPLANPSG
jgi:hypothetical protein